MGTSDKLILWFNFKQIYLKFLFNILFRVKAERQIREGKTTSGTFFVILHLSLALSWHLSFSKLEKNIFSAQRCISPIHKNSKDIIQEILPRTTCISLELSCTSRNFDHRQVSDLLPLWDLWLDLHVPLTWSQSSQLTVPLSELALTSMCSPMVWAAACVENIHTPCYLISSVADSLPWDLEVCNFSFCEGLLFSQVR